MTPLTEAQFRALVEQFVQEQGGYTEAAKLIGVSGSFLIDFLLTHPSRGAKLAAYFGFVPQVVYVRVGENKE